MSGFLNIFSGNHTRNEEVPEATEVQIQDFDMIEREEKALQDVIDCKGEASMVCMRRANIANFLSVIYANREIYDLFSLRDKDIIGKNYDFFYDAADIDSECEDQLEYVRLIKAVRDNRECSIIVSSIASATNDLDSKLHISFVPYKFPESNRNYGIFTFIKVRKDAAATLKNTVIRDNIPLVENLEKSLNSERLLREVAEVVATEQQIQNLAAKLVKILSQHLKLERCISFGFYEGVIKFAAEYVAIGYSSIIDKNKSDSKQKFKEFIEVHNRFCETFVETTESSKKIFVIDDLKSNKNFTEIADQIDALKIKTEIVIPVFLSNKIAGGIYLCNSKKRAWTEEELKTIELISNQFNIAIERSNYASKLAIANKMLTEKTAALEQALAQERDTRRIQSEFVTLVSHEFKTPLQMIDSTRELIVRKLRNNKVVDESVFVNLERIKSGIYKMNSLINSTLDLARIESDGGKMRVEIGEVSFYQIMRDAVDKNFSLANQKNVEVYCRINELPRSYLCDRKMLEHILSNVVSNAVKYSKNNSEVKIVAKELTDSYAVRVVDNGIGIPESDLEKIGQKFFRASNATSISGTGIGIYLTKCFVKMLGGDLKIESKKDHGTSITIIFPKIIKPEIIRNI